jgi:phosphoglycerol transferase MdoB-like AlkP superfamily enzyme
MRYIGFAKLPRLLFTLKTLLAFTLYLSLFRVVFFLAFNSEDHSVADLMKSFYLGFKFDLRVAALMLLPLLGFKLLPAQLNIKWLYQGLRFFWIILLFLLSYIYFVDIGFYSYLRTRLNSSFLDLVENPLISAKMTWESYPVVWLVLLLVLLTFLMDRVFARKTIPFFKAQYRNRLWPLADRFLTFLLFALCIYGKLGWYPLRWSEAFFSPKPFLSQLTINPVINFYRTNKYKGQSYEEEKSLAYMSLVREYLGVNSSDPKRPLLRERKGRALSSPPNIILIQLESLAADKTTVFNNELDPTPELKKIADQGLFFPNFFTPTEATARGVFATLTGIPDLAPSKSTSRNPMAVDQHTIINEFKNYERFYFLGGSANWGNIRSLFSYNIDELKIFEEGDYQAKRVDVWGISDLSLFKEAHQVLDQAKKPFIAYIQSSGFHRPHTLPQERGDFEEQNDISIDDLRVNGFLSLKQFNSLRFQDYALGEFFRLFKQSRYFDNTIVLMFGDHGLPSLKSQNMLPGYYKLRLVHHHVPFVVFGPEHLVPKGVNQAFGGLQDVLPTVADMAGIDYRNTTLGNSMITYPRESTFIYSWHLRPKLIGMIGKEFYYQDTPTKKELFHYKDPDDPLKDRSKDHPELFERYRELANGVYEVSRYLTFHNKKFE